MIWLVFLGEAVLMLSVSDDAGAWLRRHPLEVAIVVFMPPFLPAALQAARVFRLLRILRLVKVGLMTRRLLSTEGVRDAAVLAVVAVLGGGAAFAAIEKTDAAGHTITAWDGAPKTAQPGRRRIGCGSCTPSRRMFGSCPSCLATPSTPM